MGCSWQPGWRCWPPSIFCLSSRFPVSAGNLQVLHRGRTRDYHFSIYAKHVTVKCCKRSRSPTEPQRMSPLSHLLRPARLRITRRTTTTGIGQIAQKLFRRYQIGGAETLRKAVEDGLEAGEGIGGSAPIAEQ